MTNLGKLPESLGCSRGGLGVPFLCRSWAKLRAPWHSLGSFFGLNLAALGFLEVVVVVGSGCRSRSLNLHNREHASAWTGTLRA